MTVILDCNIYVSLVINQQIDLLAQLQENEVEIAVCDELYSELLDVLTRPKLERYLSKTTLSDVVQLFLTITTSFKIDNITEVVSDPKDNYLFALCKASKADYFVTGDKLLLNVKEYQQTKVISLADLKTIIT